MPVVVENLTDLIQKLHELFSVDRVNIEEVHEVMNSYKSNVQEWRKFAKFDRYKYTRNLVDEGNGKFNLMILCWNESQGSLIHDHADSHCFMKVLQGELQELRFAWPNDEDMQKMEDEEEPTKPMEPISEIPLRLNEVCYINDSMGLHRVINASHVEQAVSLHLYCPPFNACQVFDQRTGRRSKCPVTFWSKYGKKTDLVTCRANTSTGQQLQSV